VPPRKKPLETTNVRRQHNSLQLEKRSNLLEIDCTQRSLQNARSSAARLGPCEPLPQTRNQATRSCATPTGWSRASDRARSWGVASEQPACTSASRRTVAHVHRIRIAKQGAHCSLNDAGPRSPVSQLSLAACAGSTPPPGFWYHRNYRALKSARNPRFARIRAEILTFGFRPDTVAR
jgi:hypothetical protein